MNLKLTFSPLDVHRNLVSPRPMRGYSRWWSLMCTDFLLVRSTMHLLLRSSDMRATIRKKGLYTIDFRVWYSLPFYSIPALPICHDKIIRDQLRQICLYCVIVFIHLSRFKPVRDPYPFVNV